MLPFALAIFTSAFLVFQVQPLIARFILPWYGGAPGVWTTSMLFFQVGLLAGYFYAHLLTKILRLNHQVMVHGGLLALSLFFLPITPQLPESAHSLPQVFEILAVLAAAVSVPFILLSASAPLLQSWFAHRYPGKSPFRLYALSNVGSLLALLGYPFLVEPALTLSAQAWAWSAVYIVFIGIALWSGQPFVAKKYAQETRRASSSQPAVQRTLVSWFDRMFWLVLAASGSIVLLAVTNQMCQDVAVIPFLWVIPLSLYLITFIICFERDAWYQRKIWLPFLALSVGFLVYLLYRDYAKTELSLTYQILIYCAALFGCCMVCHGEMVRRRPTAGDLTAFYLYLSLGGALGGAFVNLIAPLIFDGFWELHGSLAVVSVIAFALAIMDNPNLRAWQRKALLVTGSVYLGTLLGVLAMHISAQRVDSVYNKRTFFGVLHVYEEGQGTPEYFRSLYHGRISHGQQWLDGSKSEHPTGYYGPTSGVGLTLTRFPFTANGQTEMGALRVGAIGLGVGTIASYGRNKDVFRFYEIDPEVESIAKRYFTFLDDSEAEIEVVIGDGRRMMRRELDTNGAQQFDVIVVDAFSGDAIPVHLLTQEASDVYWQHLKENGVLALHVSNLHVDLTGVVRQMAFHANKEALYIEDDSPDEQWCDASDWVLITSNQAFMRDPQVRRLQDEWPHGLELVAWTDDFSNLFEIVKW